MGTTLIQLIEVAPYKVIATLEYLYEVPKGGQLKIGDNKYLQNDITDKLSEDGSITRLLRVKNSWI